MKSRDASASKNKDKDKNKNKDKEERRGVTVAATRPRTILSLRTSKRTVGMMPVVHFGKHVSAYKALDVHIYAGI